MPQQNVVHLYRAILKNARFFPSSNRNKLIAEAKQLFHEHKTLTDRTQIHQELEKARVGLDELRMYAPANMTTQEGDWSVTLRGGTLPSDVSAGDIKSGK